MQNPVPDSTERAGESKAEHAIRPGVGQPTPLPQCYPCPICGGEVQEQHGHFRCTRCGQIVETCCEGAPPAYDTDLAPESRGTHPSPALT
jgi:hypothetical protein